MKKLLLCCSIITICFISNSSELNKGIELAKKGEHSQAIVFFEKAAKKGNAEALFYLGLYYIDNKQLNNPFKAVEYFRKASKKGLPKAQLQLGLMYYFGKGVTKKLYGGSEMVRKSGGSRRAICSISIRRDVLLRLWC